MKQRNRLYAVLSDIEIKSKVQCSFVQKLCLLCMTMFWCFWVFIETRFYNYTKMLCIINSQGSLVPVDAEFCAKRCSRYFLKTNCLELIAILVIYLVADLRTIFCYMFAKCWAKNLTEFFCF